VARLRRSRIYLPGNRPRMIQKGPLLGADAVILDLEDSVIPEEKDAARFLVTQAIKSLNFGETEVMVRINPLSTCGLEDLAVVLPAGPDAIVVLSLKTVTVSRLLKRQFSKVISQESGYPTADRIS